MKRAPLWLLIAAALLAAGPAGAQQTDTTVRPKLDAQADTNDWRAYFQYGMTQLRTRPSKADAAFYWASRLGPNRAEPLYGRWVAFWLRNVSVFEDYEYGSKGFPEAERAESLAARAVWRNPLLPQTLNVLIYDLLPGEWQEDQTVHLYIRCSDSQNVSQENCTLGGGRAGFVMGVLQSGLGRWASGSGTWLQG